MTMRGFYGESEAKENIFGRHEIDAMFFDIGIPFGIVPFEFHRLYLPAQSWLML